MKTNENRVLVIGLDSATFDLMKPWMREGRLPTLSKLIREGASGELKSAPNMMSPAAWTSLATGKNPGKHGIFDFYERIPGSYQVRFINGGSRDGKAIWTILSESGKSVGIINVPMTYPAEEVKGFLIAGLDAPGVESEGFLYPPELYDEIVENVGEYILQPGIAGHVAGNRHDLALKCLHESLERRVKTTKYLMKSKPWAFFFVVFTATDRVQHFFWKYMDDSHPEHSPKEARKYSDAIFKVYQRLDSVVGELLSLVDEDTIVIIMSDHGSGIKQRGACYLNGWLESIGLLRFRDTDKSGILHWSKGQLRRSSRAVIERLYKQIERQLQRTTKEKLVRLFPQIRNGVRSLLSFGQIDWEQTKAYSDDIRDYVWVNLQGRDPKGIVLPGEEYEQVIENIKEELYECVDTKTGEKVVQKVFRKEEIYHGRYLQNAPDLLIIWKDSPYITGLQAGGSAPQPLRPPHFPTEEFRVISGDHRENGILIMRGPMLKATSVENSQIMDLAPTILYLLGEPIPDEMDGKILTSAFEESFLRAYPPKYISGKGDSQRKTEDTYSDTEAETIRDRLRNLGYFS